MSVEWLLLFIVVSLVPVISPGPAIFLTIKNTIKHGARPTIYSALGNTLGLVIIGYAVSFGLGALMQTSSWLFDTVRFAGAGYLIFLGIKVWRDKSLAEVTSTGHDCKVSSFKLFVEALGIALSNPKAMALIAAIFPSFLTDPGTLLVQASVLSVAYALLCFLNHLVLIIFARKLQRTLTKRQSLTLFRGIDRHDI